MGEEQASAMEAPNSLSPASQKGFCGPVQENEGNGISSAYVVWKSMFFLLLFTWFGFVLSVPDHQPLESDQLDRGVMISLFGIWSISFFFLRFKVSCLSSWFEFLESFNVCFGVFSSKYSLILYDLKHVFLRFNSTNLLSHSFFFFSSLTIEGFFSVLTFRC